MKTEETAIIADAQAKLEEHRERLSRLGLTLSSPECEVWDSSPSAYTSEVRIKVYRNGVLHDSLEFHVFDKGQQVVTVDEARDWFDRELKALSR